MQAIAGVSFRVMHTFIFKTQLEAQPSYLDERYTPMLASLLRTFNPETMRVVSIGRFTENNSRTIPAEAYDAVDEALDVYPMMSSLILVVNRSRALARNEGVRRLIQTGRFFPRGHARDIADIQYV